MQKDTAAFVASKRKRKSPASKLKAVEVTPQISKDLADQWGAVNACATTYNLLGKGFFPYTSLKLVESSLAFLGKLHENCVEKCLEHPQADMIPDLKKIREERNGAAKKEQ